MARGRRLRVPVAGRDADGCRRTCTAGRSSPRRRRRRRLGGVPFVPALVRVDADREGRNIVQVSRWLGHHSPSFTLDVYAHLMDDGVGAPLTLEGVGSGSCSTDREPSLGMDPVPGFGSTASIPQT